jgi:hypothetical protein
VRRAIIKKKQGSTSERAPIFIQVYLNPLAWKITWIQLKKLLPGLPITFSGQDPEVLGKK